MLDVNKKLSIATPADLEHLAEQHKLDGFVEGMPAAWYHAGPGIGSGGLRKVLKTPAHYMQDRVFPKKDTDALRLGSAVHTSVLEPDLFDAQYCIKPVGTDRRTKDGKASYEKWAAANVGKVELHHEEADMIRNVTAAANGHVKFVKMLAGGIKELTVYAQGDGAMVCRVRPDIYVPKGGVIIDLKTTTDASPDGFATSIARLGYDIQAAYYMDVMVQAGLQAKHFVFAVVEKEPPYAMALYRLDEETLDIGRARYRTALTMYGDCLDVDIWPSYSQEITAIKAPRWYLSQQQIRDDE